MSQASIVLGMVLGLWIGYLMYSAIAALKYENARKENAMRKRRDAFTI